MKPVPLDPSILAEGRRHLVVLAHQDDELPFAGTLSRLLPDVRFVFLTNGDGLYFELDMEPEAYAELRRAETVASLAELGVGEDRIAFLGWSELTIYAELARMSRDADTRRPVEPLFTEIAEQVDAEAETFAPDVVWTLAWQGGHPEHDLAHLCAVRAARTCGAERESPLPIFELPAYELIAVALRFKPWDRRPRHETWLTDEELAAKMRMMECYPTQERVIGGFRRLITAYGRLGAAFGRGFDLAGFSRREEFSAVPEDRNYDVSTHVSPRLDYPFDDYEGDPIRFERTLPRIAQVLLGDG